MGPLLSVVQSGSRGVVERLTGRPRVTHEDVLKRCGIAHSTSVSSISTTMGRILESHKKHSQEIRRVFREALDRGQERSRRWVWSDRDRKKGVKKKGKEEEKK